MTHSYEELKKKTVAELRDIAAGVEHEAVQGYTQLNKDHLLTALCKALGLETHVHHDVVGIDKSAVKTRIRQLKQQRATAMAAKDAVQLKAVLRRIHSLKRQIRRATV
jgi:hypothetical protein